MRDATLFLCMRDTRMRLEWKLSGMVAELHLAGRCSSAIDELSGGRRGGVQSTPTPGISSRR